MIFANGEEITIVRALPTADRYGNVVADWSTATRETVQGCALAPRSDGEERSQSRQGVIVGHTLYAPAGTDLRAADRVEARGLTFEVEGFPESWRNPYTGVDFGVEASLRRVEG